MKIKIHAIAGVIGFLTVATFWVSTLTVEMFGSYADITSVKNAVLWGMLLLIPAMLITAGSGMSLGQGRSDSLVVSKKKRMPFIALNGLVVLVPSAFFLASKANASVFDTVFYAVQALELTAGATNLILMGLNIRDGLRLTGKLGSSSKQARQLGASIELRPAGPVIVKGLTEFSSDGLTAAAKPTMALCRCGASKNKPYCDGSHNSVGFSDEVSADRTRDQLLTYKGRELTVSYNRLLCSKAYECGRRLEAVFDTTRDPWIEPDNGPIEEGIEVIRSCPSGALSYSKNGSEPIHAVAPGPSITIDENGPYHVRNIQLANKDWGRGACEKKFSLCRCGLSKNKPFCDGSHAG